MTMAQPVFYEILHVVKLLMPAPSFLNFVFLGLRAPQYFYEEQLHRMECLSQEPVLFEDVLCQMHDMLAPAREGVFTLRDLKRHRSLAGTLFNILFNLNKFIAFETRDPFLVRQARTRNMLLCRAFTKEESGCLLACASTHFVYM